MRRVTVDIFLGPICITFALLLSLLIPVPASAQTSPAIDYQYQRAMSKIVAGSAAGLQVKQPGTINIINGGRLVGTIALQEKRLIDMATLAKYARASTVPAVLALGATELLKYGLEKCADGTWCKRDSTPQTPTEGYDWFARTYNVHASGYEAACAWMLPLFQAARCVLSEQQETFMRIQAWSINNQMIVTVTWEKQANCAEGYVKQPDGTCKKADTVLVPATEADVATAWENGFKTNPFLAEQYWGFEDQTKNNEAWAKALAELAEVIQPDTVTDVRPMETITKDGQTTKKQTTCTYAASPNSDPVTKIYNPAAIVERCTTTTTNPDGTQSTEVTEKGATPVGGSETKVPPKVDVETCGLPGKPACKIDETGTKTEADAQSALDQRTSELEQQAAKVMTDAQAKLDSVTPAHESAHFFSFFNVFPQFAIETCANPQVPEYISGRIFEFDLCKYYYIFKDCISFVMSLLTMVSMMHMVRNTAATS